MKQKLESLYASLEEVREETYSLISGLDHDVMERKVEKEWSISQLLKHLALSELGSIKVVNSLVKKSDTPLPPYPEDESSIEFNSPTQLPGKLICPKVVTPPDTVAAEEALAELKELRKATRETLELLSTVDPTCRTMEHPFFGECNMYEWFSFLIDHEKVHQKQMKEVLARIREGN